MTKSIGKGQEYFFISPCYALHTKMALKIYAQQAILWQCQFCILFASTRRNIFISYTLLLLFACSEVFETQFFFYVLRLLGKRSKCCALTKKRKKIKKIIKIKTTKHVTIIHSQFEPTKHT